MGYWFFFQNLSSVIQDVNGFLNLPPLNDDQMKKLNHILSFQSMKNNQALYSPLSSLQAKKSDEKGEGNFIRKGIVRNLSLFLKSESKYNQVNR